MAQVEVHLWSGLRRLTGGEEIVSVNASTIGQMLVALETAHPGLGPILDAGVSVSLNGEIVNGGRFREISEGDEIFLMQLIKGG